MGRVRSLGKRVFGIGDLSDIDTTGLDDGEVLVYSSSSGKFEPGSVSAPVDSVNGQTGAVVLDIDDFAADGSTTGSDPDGTTLSATATIGLLTPGGLLEDEYTFAVPTVGVAGGHHITLVNVCGAAATIKGVTGGDITLADDRSITLVYAGSAWYRADYTA